MSLDFKPKKTNNYKDPHQMDIDRMINELEDELAEVRTDFKVIWSEE